MKLFFFTALLFTIFSSCAHSVITPFQASVTNNAAKAYPSTSPENVGIYRSQRPFSSFVELGMISCRSRKMDLPDMYERLRKDAAAFGAQAIINVKITSEVRTEYEPRNDCSPRNLCEADGSCVSDNDCHVIQVPVQVDSFLIAGSMIRKKL